MYCVIYVCMYVCTCMYLRMHLCMYTRETHHITQERFIVPAACHQQLVPERVALVSALVENRAQVVEELGGAASVAIVLVHIRLVNAFQHLQDRLEIAHLTGSSDQRAFIFNIYIHGD